MALINNLGLLELDDGNPTKALELFEQCMVILTADSEGISFAIINNLAITSLFN
jgi:hypothetical protein